MRKIVLLVLLPVIQISCRPSVLGLKELVVQDYEFSEYTNGIFNSGSDNNIELRFDYKGETNTEGTLYYKVLLDSGEPIYSSHKKLSLSKNVVTALRIDSLPVIPNFYKIEYYFKDDRTRERFGGKVNFGVDPFNIEYDSSIPEDFIGFWKATIDSLKTFKPEYRIENLEKHRTETHSVELVEMNSFNDVSIYGYLIKPLKNHYNKVLLHFGGYSGGPSPEKRFFLKNIAVFVVGIRGHGLSKKDFDPGFSKDEYLTYGLPDKYRFSYRGAITDAVRSVDFICSKYDNEKMDIYINGGSQGAGIALAATALDKRIKACMADIPFLTNFKQSFKTAPWPYAVYKKYASEHDVSIDTISNILRYFDTKNFFNMIEVPVLLGIGLQDNICPPRTAFSLINQDKKEIIDYILYPKSGHGLPKLHFASKMDWLAKIDSK